MYYSFPAGKKTGRDGTRTAESYPASFLPHLDDAKSSSDNEPQEASNNDGSDMWAHCGNSDAWEVETECPGSQLSGLQGVGSTGGRTMLQRSLGVEGEKGKGTSAAAWAGGTFWRDSTPGHPSLQSLQKTEDIDRIYEEEQEQLNS